jgi:hypothetical protein
MDDITNQPKPTQAHITGQPAPPAHPARPAAANVRAQTDFIGYVLLVLGVAALTILMAVIGGPVLVGVVGVVTVLAVVHYWTWGRSLGRKVADEQARQFRDRMEDEGQHLSEVERPRHY